MLDLTRYTASCVVDSHIAAAMSPGAKRVNAPAVSPAPITRWMHVRFHQIEDLHMYNPGETTAKVISGRVRNTRQEDVLYRCILTDLSGYKMLAVAYGRTVANRFSNELRNGEVYFFRGVGFQSAEAAQFGLVRPASYYVVMHSLRQIHLVDPSVSIPRLPSQFMDFVDASKLPNKMLIGALKTEGSIRRRVMALKRQRVARAVIYQSTGRDALNSSS